MEQDKIKTLCKYVDIIADYYDHVDFLGELSLGIDDLKSPLTLVGYTANANHFIILRGYKEKSLIRRYLRLKDVKYTFFIVSPKTLVTHKISVRWDDVSTKYFI